MSDNSLPCPAVTDSATCLRLFAAIPDVQMASLEAYRDSDLEDKDKQFNRMVGAVQDILRDQPNYLVFLVLSGLFFGYVHQAVEIVEAMRKTSGHA